MQFHNIQIYFEFLVRKSPDLLERASEEEKAKGMKTLAMDYFGETEEQSGGVTVAMDVDDVDSSLDLFGEGPISMDLHRLADSEFFNSFQDDFDDGDIN